MICYAVERNNNLIKCVLFCVLPPPQTIRRPPLTVCNDCASLKATWLQVGGACRLARHSSAVTSHVICAVYQRKPQHLGSFQFFYY